jgi:hypothetical protein
VFTSSFLFALLRSVKIFTPVCCCPRISQLCGSWCRRLLLKCDCTRAETRFRLSAKRMSPFKPTGASVQLTAGSRVVRIRGSNAGYTIFRGSVKSTGFQLHSPVSLSLPLPCVTVCHIISTGLYVYLFIYGVIPFLTLMSYKIHILYQMPRPLRLYNLRILHHNIIYFNTLTSVCSVIIY